MPTSLLVVDDFLGPRDALALRDAGLRLTYPPDQKGAFPGRNSVERVEIDGLTAGILLDAKAALVLKAVGIVRIDGLQVVINGRPVRPGSDPI